MQLDMHYYATYAMARATGLEPDDARIIATSAQFVDDNVARSHVEFGDGSRLDQEATAHHPIDLSNRDDRDQRRVWVPFHFIPGNEGDGYTERLKCRMDSPIVRELRDHHLTYANCGFGLHLLGITAHVYADTFSHYGFSGVSSRGNKVDNPKLADTLSGAARSWEREGCLGAPCAKAGAIHRPRAPPPSAPAATPNGTPSLHRR